MNEGFWGLPGPQKFAAEVAHAAHGGRHVAAIAPAGLLRDEIFADGLAQVVVDRLYRLGRDPRRVSDSGTGLSLVSEIGQVFTFDEPPVTVPDLLEHEQTAGGIAVMCDRDLACKQRTGISDLLRRLDLESRSRQQDKRLTVVAIVSNDRLPTFQGGSTSDVTIANVWWWGRLSRWDIAAHLSDLEARRGEFTTSGVLADVRAETIIELARWEFDLVEHLATTWSGDFAHLAGAVLEHGAQLASSVPDSTRECSLSPDADGLPLWDRCELDGWHGTWSPSAAAVLDDPARLQRRVWAAQARVLLPWIEERRVRVQELATAAIGTDRLNAFLDLPGNDPHDVIEIGPLFHVINALIGSANQRLRDAARRLMDARNALAHLDPVPQAQLSELTRACSLLQQ